MKMHGRKALIITVLLILIALVLPGCKNDLATYFCKHDWQKSTCQTPRTCKLCGLTEGKVRSHEWGSTDCSNIQGCIVCGTTEGMEITHQWREDCKICANCGLDERPADDRFMDSLAAGLEARWQLMDVVEAEEDAVPTKEDWAQYFDAEYSQIASYKEETFTDEALGAAARRYIGSIEKSIEALDLFGTDAWEDAYHSSAYSEQVVSLFQIHSIRPVEVAEERQETLKDMLITGEVIDMAYPLIDQVMFLLVQDNKGGKKYETTIRNTTSITYEWFLFEVDLLDENGNVLETEIAKVTWWEPDERVRFNFTTRKDFSAMDVRVANWILAEEFGEEQE